MPDVAMDGLGSEDGDGSEDDDDEGGVVVGPCVGGVVSLGSPSAGSGVSASGERYVSRGLRRIEAGDGIAVVVAFMGVVVVVDVGGGGKRGGGRTSMRREPGSTMGQREPGIVTCAGSTCIICGRRRRRWW